MIVVILMMASARHLCKTNRVVRAVSWPVIGVGMNRMAVSTRERSCTFWKKRLITCSKALNAPQIMNSFTQIHVKARFFQSEFQINVGLLRRSWKLCQRTKKISKSPDNEKQIMVDASCALFMSPVISLFKHY